MLLRQHARLDKGHQRFLMYQQVLGRLYADLWRFMGIERLLPPDVLGYGYCGLQGLDREDQLDLDYRD